MLKSEIRTFLASIIFFTRLPIFRWINISEDDFRGILIYFPIIGLIVGGFSALIYFLSTLVFSFTVSIILSMITSIIITGALHEDGLADFCDSLGAENKAKALSVMKDSNIGTYGVIGLISVLGIQFLSLEDINPSLVPLIIICAHTISRSISISIPYQYEYVRSSQSKSYLVNFNISSIQFLIVFLIGVIPMVLFQDTRVFLLLIPLVIIRFILAYLFNKKIGGFTGDCLGATQKISEVAFYLFFPIVHLIK